VRRSGEAVDSFLDELHGGILVAADDDARHARGGRLDDDAAVALAARREREAESPAERRGEALGLDEAGSLDTPGEAVRLDRGEERRVIRPVAEQVAAEVGDPLLRLRKCGHEAEDALLGDLPAGEDDGRLGLRLGRWRCCAAVLSREPYDRSANAVLEQPRLVEPREAERLLPRQQAELLDEPADIALAPSEVVAPVRARPELVPVDGERVAAERPCSGGGEQREVREGRGVDGVVAPAVPEKMPEDAEPEEQRLVDSSRAPVVVERPRPVHPDDADAGQGRLLAALPLPAGQVRDLVAPLREPLREIGVPALRSADRVRIEAVVDDADPHARASVPANGRSLEAAIRFRLR